MSVDVLGWAAVSAAVISLANLVVTTIVAGTRAETTWARDTLTEVVTAFLDASWSHTDAVSSQLKAGHPADEMKSAAQAAYGSLRHQLTRLRILGSPRLRDAGLDLVARHRRLRDASEADTPAALRHVSEGRQRLISAAKKELRLR